MLQLPSRPSPICLRGFILSLGSMLLMLTALSSALLPLLIVLIFGVATGVLIVTCMAYPRFGLILYKVWNRLAGYFACFSRTYLMAICYFLIISPVGKICSTLRLAPPGSSKTMWVPKRLIDPTAYRSLDGFPAHSMSRPSSWRSFVSWGLRTNNLWAWILLPLISLLGFLEPEKEAEVSNDIYTLF